MSYKRFSVAIIALLALEQSAYADGELNIYNWGNYTSPDLIKRFEEMFDIRVSVSEYQSNDEALAKVRQPGHGFDIVVPGSDSVPVWISEGLVLKTTPAKMANFSNVSAEWTDPPFDRGRKYSAPWTWGSTGITVNTNVYKGDPNTSAIFLDPPSELIGKINIVPEMSDIMSLAIMYVGGKPCTEDLQVLKKVRDKLKEAKQKWMSLDYLTPEAYAKGDVAAGTNYNGESLRARLKNKDIVFGYPKEGFNVWSTQVMVLADAKNVENAKLFQNFIMAPENAAMISAFTKNANAIRETEALLPRDMKGAPELKIPFGLVEKANVMSGCSAHAHELYTKIWTDLMK